LPVFRIEIAPQHPTSQAKIVQSAQHLNTHGLTACHAARLFFIEGDLTESDAAALASSLLADPVTEFYRVGASPAPHDAALVETTFQPGVTDPAAESLLRSAHLKGFAGVTRCATGHRYTLHGTLTPHELHRIATEILSNPVIQRYVEGAPIDAPFVPFDAADDTVESVPLIALDDAGLMAVSQERRLSLDIHEMHAIRDYYLEIQRDPTDAELEMLAQTWSEHCVHKTFKANITYTGPAHGAPADSAPTQQQIHGLLKTYLRAATDKLDKAWVRSAFVDNAGIVKFDETWDIAFKAETHNRPSAIEPFGGANTGVGGVIRDVLGVSARPIANTDILCFGLPDADPESLPQGVLHPRRIADGVIGGVEDYGNKMGIPTVNGAVFFHQGYTANPLVFCGCVGILPHGTHRNQAQAGDLIVLIGGRTGRDGLRGATFSSMEMDTTTAKVSGGAVQIGHAINEKQVQEVVLRARDEGLYTAITDCGAGGLSSAVGEMGESIGATVHLERVPLKYPGLRPWKIWLSEAQERMVFAVPESNWARFKAICDGQDVEAVAIGTFDPTGHMTLYYEGRVVGDIAMHFLHDGIPTRNLTAVWTPPTLPAREATHAAYESLDLQDALLTLLAHPNIRSKEDVVRKYDHEVQTGMAVKPFVGEKRAGPGDAAVIIPLDTIPLPAQNRGHRAIALSNGLAPQYTALDPYAMAWAAVDEAVRNVVAVGADPEQVAILDNFSWGNAVLPDRLGTLVRASQGCYDAALHYGTPFISGKDSLNNEYLGADGQRHAIPGTLVISALGIVPMAERTVTMDFKEAGNMLYLVGATRDELGGSHLHEVFGIAGGLVPQPVRGAPQVYKALYWAIHAGTVRACHDVSEGGLAVALAEMGIAGGLGAWVNASNIAPQSLNNPTLEDVVALFSESAGRFVVEVQPDACDAFESLLLQVEGATFAQIGTVGGDPRLVIETGSGARVDVLLEALESAWRGHVRATEETHVPHIPPFEGRGANLRPLGRIGTPKVLILHANGTNRDRDAVLACELAGGDAEIVHVNQLISGERSLLDYHMLVIPGGFSYGDDLGAGVLWALDLRERLRHVDRFVQDGRPVLGICNGFQTLVKAGLLPGDSWEQGGERSVTLTYNARGQFECRWVYLQANPKSPSLFTEGIDELIHCPIAHGEGRVAVKDDATLARLWADGLASLVYVDAHGQAGGYPINPNGSVYNIAALSNPEGNVFGLMPHPENHIFVWQHPQAHRGISGMSGLKLFQNGIKRA